MYCFKLSLNQVRNKQSLFQSHFPKKKSLNPINFSNQILNIWGYYQNFEPQLNENQLIDKLTNKNWQFLNQANLNFVFFIYFKISQEFFALVDHACNFPIFWAKINNEIVFSSHVEYLIKLIPNLTIDLNAVTQLVNGDTGVEANCCLFKNINILYPNCLLRVDIKKKISIQSYLELTLVDDQRNYHDLNKFYQDFMALGSEVVQSQFKSIKNQEKIACDLSAGLDSCLVNYWLKQNPEIDFTSINIDKKKPYHTENANIIKAFSKKHHLNLLGLTDQLEELDSQVNDWNNYPWPVGLFRPTFYFDYLINNGFSTRFSGCGGNELYSGHSVQNDYLLKPYFFYYGYVSQVDADLKNILNYHGIQIFLDKQIYQKKNYYPSLVTSSVIDFNILEFQWRWHYDLACFHPFLDKNLLKLGRLLPKINHKPLARKEFYQQTPLKNIFLADQLQKNNLSNQFEAQTKQLIITARKKIISYLSDSILADLGLFRINEIINDFQENNISKYQSNLRLISLIRMEVYLKKISKSKHILFSN